MWLEIGMMGAGLIMKDKARRDAADAQEAEELANAAFYREQAEFAEAAGKRAQSIFDNESVILLGDQESVLSHSGVGPTTSANYLAKESLFREQERLAIGLDADANARLAYLRADQSTRRAMSSGAGNRDATIADVIGTAGSALRDYNTGALG